MNIKKRLYNDFFRPSKIDEYEKILQCAVKEGYEIHTIVSFEDVIGKINTDKKYLIMRRDVDTADYGVMQQFLALEKKYKARCSYYFRLSTIDYDFMKAVEKGGGEASYHYEELAVYCYQHRIKNKQNINSHLDAIRKLFVKNYSDVKKKSGLPCLTIASHGDFVNAILELPNTILIDSDIRKECNIVREAYDNVHMNCLSYRIADQNCENFSQDAVAAMKRGEKVLELLMHPRQWNSPLLLNLKEEIRRLYRGFMWSMC